MLLQLSRDSLLYVNTICHSQGGESALEKCVDHSLKNLGPSQRTLRRPWCLKLMTGLIITNYVSDGGRGVKYTLTS